MTPILFSHPRPVVPLLLLGPQAGGISILVGDGAISGPKIVKKAAWQGRGG